MLNNLNSWSNPIKGMYRNVISTSVCYEIMILKHDGDADILNARASLYISGDWQGSEGWYYERELLFTGPVKECLDDALKDYNEHVDLYKEVLL